jgi:DNA-binding transcriptional regulator WhiA
MRRSRTRAVSAALQEAARLRLAHPEYTIAELAARARPPVSKAAMAYRLRTIERQA